MAAYKATKEQLASLKEVKIFEADLCALGITCEKAKHPIGVWHVLVWAVQRLAVFEKYEKSEIKTDKERLDSIKAVETAARALYETMKKLSPGDFMQLDWGLARTDFPRLTSPKSLCDRSAAVQELASMVERASRRMLGDLAAEGITGKGPKKTRSAYASHIAVLAHQLMPYKLKPGSKGHFRLLCDEVFSAAGVHASSEGAIVHFQKTLMPRMKEERQCL